MAKIIKMNEIYNEDCLETISTKLEYSEISEKYCQMARERIKEREKIE